MFFVEQKIFVFWKGITAGLQTRITYPPGVVRWALPTLHMLCSFRYLLG